MDNITLGELVRVLLANYLENEAKWVTDIGFDTNGNYVFFLKDVDDKESQIVVPIRKETK